MYTIPSLYIRSVCTVVCSQWRGLVQDLDGDGHVSIDEFMAAMKVHIHPSLYQSVRICGV